MKKTDEMSSNFIKLQMKLENMSDEHKDELIKVKEESFNEGVEAGKEQALKDEESKLTSGLSQLSASVATLESSASEYERALEGIKSELISAALDISKEVINVELGESSSEIATILSNELIKELQSASKITLKVNPKNHGEISKNIGSLEHIEVISDSAVSEGGVIVISDAGNIDAQISKRFERVKRAALSE
jgi:flagellar assembly protein FliH